MKTFPLIFCAFLLLAACGSGGENTKPDFTPPAAGSIIASDSMRISEDVLNETYFSVRILTTPRSAEKGIYEIAIGYGNNRVTDGFTMPAGGERLQPLLRPGADANNYVIGFEYKGNFYEYVGITGSRNRIEVNYLKYYNFRKAKD
jgi:hypothetical protein